MSSVKGTFTNSRGTLKLEDFLQDVASEMMTNKEIVNAVWSWVEDDLEPILKANASGGILEKRSGKLSTAIRAVPKLTGRLGNRGVKFEIKARGIPYARIHEEGGEITPSTAQYLAIPFPNSPAWNMAMTGKKVSPSDYEGKGFFKKSKNGNLIFFVRDRGSKDGLIPMFLMKESVTIPARHWISKSVGEAVAMLSARMLIAEKLSAFAKG